ncbi:MAG: hypothetical protein AAB922_06390 [Patescibacteria group bacterium]
MPNKNMLQEIEIDQIQKLLQDDILLKIVKKVLYQTIAGNIPEIREGQTNELIGEKYRAYEQAKGIIEAAFFDLNSYLKVENKEKIKDFNKGR